MNIFSRILAVIKDPRRIVFKVGRVVLHNRLTQKSEKKGEEFYFIQIGSNDGVSNDPLNEYILKYGWTGICVEPIMYVYEKLKQTYKDQKNISFENVAISDTPGFQDFYQLEKNDELGDGYDRLGSFHKETLLKSRDRFPGFDKYLIKEKIRCISFEQLLEKHNVKHIDLLHIDAEGHDYKILKTLPIESIQPDIILFERIHLTSKEKRAVKKFLKPHGYKFLYIELDALAYK